MVPGSSRNTQRHCRLNARWLIYYFFDWTGLAFQQQLIYRWATKKIMFHLALHLYCPLLTIYFLSFSVSTAVGPLQPFKLQFQLRLQFWLWLRAGTETRARCSPFSWLHWIDEDSGHFHSLVCHGICVTLSSPPRRPAFYGGRDPVRRIRWWWQQLRGGDPHQD